MASRKSSILKPSKVREPLQDLNQLLPCYDDDETTTITGLNKRRVSFASMNKVKEFEAAAECVTLLNTPAYDERFSSISSDSCHSSVLSLSHTDIQKITKEASVQEDLAAEEEIELTETVGGSIYESAIKNRADSSMEYTVPCPSNLSLPQQRVPDGIINQERIDCETSCMETTEVITNNMFSEAVISEMCTDTEYEGETVASECHDMEISPHREALPVSRKSIFHRDQDVPSRKSIFDLPPTQPRLDFRNFEILVNPTTNEDSMSMDMSFLPAEEKEEILPSRTLDMTTMKEVHFGPKRSIFSQLTPNPGSEPMNMAMTCPFVRYEETAAGAHNQSLPVLSQTARNNSHFHNLSMQQPLINQTEYNNSSMRIVSQEIETRMEGKLYPETNVPPLLGKNLNQTNVSVSDFPFGCPEKYESENKTCYDDSGMRLVSQEVNAMVEYEKINETQHNNSDMQFVSQEENAVDACGVTGIDYETVNKTRYNNSNMVLASQEGNAVGTLGIADETNYDNANTLSPNEGELGMDLKGISDKTGCNNSSTQLAGQEKKSFIANEMTGETCPRNSIVHSFSQVKNVTDPDVIVGKLDGDDSTTPLVDPKRNAIDASELPGEICLGNSNACSIPTTGEDAIDVDGVVRQTICKNSLMTDKTFSDNTDCRLTNREENSVDLFQISDKMCCSNVHPETNVATGLQNVTINELGVDQCEGDEVNTQRKDNANEDKNSAIPLVNLITRDCTLVGEVDVGPKTQDVETRQLNLPGEGECEVLHSTENANKSKIDIQKSFSDNNSSVTTSDSNSPLTVGVNFSIFQKNKETRVEFSGTIDSNKRERSKSISNVQVNIINNKAKREEHNVQKLRFSMPSTQTKFDEATPRVYASFMDVNVPSNDQGEKNLSKLEILSDNSLKPVHVLSPILQNESSISLENVEPCSDGNRVEVCSKKRLSSEMLPATDEEEIKPIKRRSISTLQKCEMVTETISSMDVQDVGSDSREVCTTTQVRERRQSIVYENQSTFVAAENVIVETCSQKQTLTCITNTVECTETTGKAPAQSPLSPSDKECESLNAPEHSDEKRFSVKVNENSSAENPAQPVVDETCPRKSLLASNVSSKSSLSDTELSTKDQSIELRSDNDSERYPAQVHSTPCRKRSIKSLGSHSALEDDLIDSLNNPSIIVNIGDSFDLCSESVSTVDTREGSGNKMNEIETVPSDDVSKVHFVSDWLQNRTKVISVLHNHSSSSHKALLFEKNAVNSCKLADGAVQSQTGDEKAKSVEALAPEESVGEVENSPTENQLKDVENVIEETEGLESALIVEIEDLSARNKPSEADTSKTVADEIIRDDENLVELVTTAQPVSDEVPPLQNIMGPEEAGFKRGDDLDSVEPVDDALANEQESDCFQRINLDLMDVSTDNVDAEEEQERLIEIGETSPVTENARNEEFVENMKKKILETIREEHLSHNHDWRRKSVTDDEWILQISEYRDLGMSLNLPRDVTVKLIPALVVRIEPRSTKCSASFKFISETLPERYRDVLEISIRALRLKCRKKIETMCRTIEDIPCLLKSLTEDVAWMLRFTQNLKKIGGMEAVQYKRGKASFTVASYRNLIAFHVHVNLNNLMTLSVNDIEVVPHIGKVDTNRVLKIFSESGRDFDFFSKFVKKLVSTFDS